MTEAIYSKVQCGKHRGARSLGRNPFATISNRFLSENSSYYASSTIANFHRLFRRLNRIFIELKDAGLVDTINPLKMKEKEIAALINYMRTTPPYKGCRRQPQQKDKFDASTVDKYLDYMNRLLLFSNNGILDHLREAKKGLFPREVRKEITVISPLTLQGIQQSAAKIYKKRIKEAKRAGKFKSVIEYRWRRAVATFALQVYPTTGLRPSELRKANLEDIDTTNWILRVSNPKGKDNYTMGRSVGIIPSIQEAFVTYLAERDRYLRRHNQPDTAPLIPYCPHKRHQRARIFSQGEWSKLKLRVQRVAGIRFKWKDFRSTFCQNCIDNGAKVESVSVLLGHSSTKVTEAYYGRIRNDRAMEEVAQALEKRIVIPILSTSK